MANLNYISTVPALFGIFTPENFELLHARVAARSARTSRRPAAFFRTRPDLPAPDVEFHFSPSLFYDEGLTAPHDHGYVFGPVLVKPTARGRVMLRTPMADSKPRVLCNFLTTEEDRATFVAGTRLALEVAGQRALQDGHEGAVQRAGLRLRRGHPRVGPAATASPSTTRRRRARSARSSTPSCASTGSRACASSTRP